MKTISDERVQQFVVGLIAQCAALIEAQPQVKFPSSIRLLANSNPEAWESVIDEVCFDWEVDAKMQGVQDEK